MQSLNIFIVKLFRLLVIVVTVLFLFIKPSFSDSETNAYLKTVAVGTFNKHIPRLDMFAAAKKANWFEQGNPNALHQLYVIAEPNCSACHYLYESIRPYINNGSLKVRWIMVAFLKSSCLDKAATIISAKNPALELENNESEFNEATETGGVVPKTSIQYKARNFIIKNNEFMKHYGFKQTPIIIFKSTTGKTEVLRGAPEQNKWAELLPYIGKYS